MSLILAIRANGKAYFCSDRRVLCGAVIKREQDKLFVLISKKDGSDTDIVVGICGAARFLTLIADPRNQHMVKELYKENPTIYGLVDSIVAMFEKNGTEAEKDPGNQGSYNLRMVIGYGEDLYEVSRDLVIYKVPPTDLATGGSGGLIASAFWAGKDHMPGAITPVLEGDDLARAIDDVNRRRLQEVFDYVARVDSGVGPTIDFYSYDLKLTA